MKMIVWSMFEFPATGHNGKNKSESPKLVQLILHQPHDPLFYLAECECREEDVSQASSAPRGDREHTSLPS